MLLLKKRSQQPRGEENLSEKPSSPTSNMTHARRDTFARVSTDSHVHASSRRLSDYIYVLVPSLRRPSLRAYFFEFSSVPCRPPSLFTTQLEPVLVRVCVLLPCFPFSGTVVFVKFRVVLTHTTSPSQTTSSRHRETVFVSPCPPELVLLWSARVLQHSTAGTVSEQLRTSTLVPPKTK